MNSKLINHHQQPKQLLSQKEHDALLDAFLITMFLTSVLISGFTIVTRWHR